MTSEDRQLVLEGAGLGSGSMRDLSSAERAAFLHNLDDPDTIAEAAERNAKLANIRALPGKTALNFAEDKLAADPLSQYAEQKIAHALGVGVDG